jgi:hypothetical protein
MSVLVGPLILLYVFVVYPVITFFIASWLARRLNRWRLARWHVPRWLIFIIACLLFGVILGVITMPIPNQLARFIVNPWGSGAADWIHENWWAVKYRPDNWETIIPWGIRYPQVYLFSTMAGGVLYGVLITLIAIKGDRHQQYIGISLPDTTVGDTGSFQ